MDGHPLLPVSPGATYHYAFPIVNRGGTYWYHPHAHGTNARQTYSSLADFFIVEDEDERVLSEALDLTLGKMFDEGGDFVYAPGPMDEEMGYEGAVVLTNLTPNPYLEVGPARAARGPNRPGSDGYGLDKGGREGRERLGAEPPSGGGTQAGSRELLLGRRGARGVRSTVPRLQRLPEPKRRVKGDPAQKGRSRKRAFRRRIGNRQRRRR
jgi:hypothetical protein